MSDESKKGKEAQLQIQLEEEIAQGLYANLAVINHSDAEFILDFIFVQPQVPRAKVRSRVITSPRHAKRLLLALQENVVNFEKKFGPIDLGGMEGVAQEGEYH